MLCRDDAGLALAGRDDARAVRSDQPRLLALRGTYRLEHVDDRNAFGDADGERIPASAASMIASAANGGGTKITVAFAPVSCTGVVNAVEDRPAFVRRSALAGRDAADDLRAVGRRRLAWNVPSRPVSPWTMSRVFLSSRTAIRHARLSDAPRTRPRLHSCRAFAHRIRGREIQAAFTQHPLALLDVGPFHANRRSAPARQAL